MFDDLARARIRYCSWKSNEHLLDGLAGETDIDLLVDRVHADAFDAVALRHGLKRLRPVAASDFPGMEHYLGLDRGCGRLFHLHVHHQLVLGEQHVKNHRLPVEHHLLSETTTLHGVAVPRPEWELAILAVRILLKYRARDAVKDILGIRTPGIRPPVAAELQWLLARTTAAAVAAATRDVPAIPTDVVARFVDTVGRPGRHGLTMVRLRSRLRRALEHQQRGSRAGAYRTGAQVRWSEFRRRRSGRGPAKMTVLHGGTTVAFVGADGAGKSTIADANARWLGWKVDARVHYLGSKPPSRASATFYLLFRALRRTERAASSRLGGDAFVAHTVRTTRDIALASHHLAVAHQRARSRAAGLRDAAAGRVVLFDRYPFEQLPSARARQLFDGSQIPAAVAGAHQPIITSLARAEARIYERYELPDAVVLLDVDPRVASSRKPDHDAGVIFEKARAASAIVDLVAQAGSTVVRVDSTMPLEAVIEETKAAVWDAV
ncbi:MAG TPA: hypothetical protein VFZ17_02740 [Acidimicrobiia bacterium]|nr:hypothetical protein [Acidimicrobiia bacterium]